MVKTVEGTIVELALRDLVVRKSVGPDLSEILKVHDWNPAQMCYGSPMLVSVVLTGIGVFV